MSNLNGVLQRLLWIPSAVLLLSLVIGAGTLASWANDDAPPFVNGPYTVTPARAGEGVMVSREVTRDTTRTCSITYSRYLVDSAGRLHELAAAQKISPLMRATLAKVSPGRRDEVIQLPREATPGRRDEVIQLPREATPGPAIVLTDLHYACNPLQKWFPIYIRSELDIEVLP